MALRSLEQVFKNPTLRKYKKGHIILHQGDELVHTFYVKKGYVKMYSITDEGDQRILLIFPAGTAFPLLPNMTVPKFIINYFYEAMTDVELVMSGRIELAKFLEDDPEAAQLALNYIIELSADAVRRISTIESKDAKHKLSRLLHYLIKVCGKEVKANHYRLGMKITHQDMADMTGLARETASIQIKKLEDERIITQQDGYMIIDQSLLPEEY